MSEKAKAGNLSIISKGKERPQDPGHNEPAWARDRHVEFYPISGRRVWRQAVKKLRAYWTRLPYNCHIIHPRIIVGIAWRNASG
jgi:hypothetical protein